MNQFQNACQLFYEIDSNNKNIVAQDNKAGKLGQGA